VSVQWNFTCKFIVLISIWSPPIQFLIPFPLSCVVQKFSGCYVLSGFYTNVMYVIIFSSLSFHSSSMTLFFKFHFWVHAQCIFICIHDIACNCIGPIYHIWEKKCSLLLSELSCLHLKRCSPVSFTHMQMTIFLSSLWPNNISHFLNLFISVEHLVCFHSLPIMNNA
jgi:hypothetical protein